MFSHDMVQRCSVFSYDTPMPAWSCGWNADDGNYFYTGLQNGLVLEFDIRNTESFVQEINSGGSRSPVAALQYMPRCLQATFRYVISLLDKTNKMIEASKNTP